MGCSKSAGTARTSIVAAMFRGGVDFLNTTAKTTRGRRAGSWGQERSQRRRRGTSRSRTVLRPSAAAARMASSQIARTCSLRSSATASDVFMPERSLMYFFILETTISTSRSKADDSVGPPAVDGCDDETGAPDATGAAGVTGETIRRGGLVSAEAPPGDATVGPP